MKNAKTRWVFVSQKYGKFWSVLLGHFIKHKPPISEEWLHIMSCQNSMENGILLIKILILKSHFLICECPLYITYLWMNIISAKKIMYTEQNSFQVILYLQPEQLILKYVIYAYLAFRYIFTSTVIFRNKGTYIFSRHFELYW